MTERLLRAEACIEGHVWVRRGRIERGTLMHTLSGKGYALRGSDWRHTLSGYTLGFGAVLFVKQTLLL